MLLISIINASCPNLKNMVVPQFDVTKAMGNWYQPIAQDPFQKNCRCPMFKWTTEKYDLALDAECDYIGARTNMTTLMRQEYTETDGITKYTEFKTIVKVQGKIINIPISFLQFDNAVLYVKEGTGKYSGIYEEMILYQCTYVTLKKVETIEYYTRYIPTNVNILKKKIENLPFDIYTKNMHTFSYENC